MITVRRSDTGTHVLVHEPSQTVMVGDDLEATYARLQEHVRDLPTHGLGTGPAPTPSRRGAWLVGVGVLALLPFLWLAVLHYTLGRLVDELRATPAPAPVEEVEALRSELEELRQVVSRVEDEVGRSRRSPPPRPATKRPSDEADPKGDAPDSAADSPDGTDADSPADSADGTDARPRPRIGTATATAKRRRAGDGEAGGDADAP